MRPIGLLLLAAAAVQGASRPPEKVLVDGPRARDLRYLGQPWFESKGCLTGNGAANAVRTAESLGAGDFLVRLHFSAADLEKHEVAVLLGESVLRLHGPTSTIHGAGKLYGGADRALAGLPRSARDGKPIEIEWRRAAGRIRVLFDTKALHEGADDASAVGPMEIRPGGATVRIQRWSVAGTLVAPAAETAEDELALQPRIDAAIDRGVAWLLARQLRDGSFASHAHPFLGGMTALAAYTLRKCGLPATHPALVRAYAHLDVVEPRDTYSVGAMLLAYGALHDPARAPRMQQLVERLLGISDDGHFGYLQPNDPPYPGYHDRRDLSNLQFAVLGLRAARESGVAVPPEVWSEILSATMRYQESPKTVDAPAAPGRTGTGKAYSAGFGYYGRLDPYGSMTAAGICSVQFCVEALGKEIRRDQAMAAQRSIEMGLRWLSDRFTVTANPSHGGNLHYWLYGLERVGSSLRIETIGDRRWYLEGARFLVEKQGDQGDWYSAYEQADTCFALLFLKRATSSVASGERSQGAPLLHVAEAEASPVHFRGTGNGPTTVWITAIGAGSARKAAADAGLRVAAVEYLVDGRVAARLEGDASRPWTAADRFPAALEFDAPGEHRVSLRVHLAAGDGTRALENPVLENPGFVVRVDAVLEPWMAEAARARSRNLLLGAGAVVTASSEANGGERAPAAVDGLEGTRWVCAKGDAEPWLLVEIPRPIEADHVVLGSGCVNQEIAGRYDRIRRVEIRIDREKTPFVLDVDGDERKPIVCPLPKALRVNRMEIRITRREPGGVWKGHVGLSEVALERRG